MTAVVTKKENSFVDRERLVSTSAEPLFEFKDLP